MADHLIGSPLAFASNAYATKAWAKFSDIPALQHPDVDCVQGSLVQVSPDVMEATIKLNMTGETVHRSYDYFIAATGLRRNFLVVPQSLTKKRYLLETATHVRETQHAEQGVVVIGGGAVGIEMAAETKLCHPSIKVTLVHSRDQLLSAEPVTSECKEVALHALREAGVEVILNQRVMDVTADDQKKALARIVTLQDGTTIPASQIITAISKSVPATSYLPRSVLNDDGLVRIDDQ